MDNGLPWGSWSDLPPALALWLWGLKVEVVWNPPRHPQANGVVEREQGVLQQWVEVGQCAEEAEVQRQLTWAARIQREVYPLEGGASRMETYAGLRHSGRPYKVEEEKQLWDFEAVSQRLGQGLWVRKVDKVGRISLYNRPYGVGRSHAGQKVYVRFEAKGPMWVISDAQGKELQRHTAQEITPERILQLDVLHRKKASGITHSTGLALTGTTSSRILQA